MGVPVLNVASTTWKTEAQALGCNRLDSNSRSITRLLAV